MNIVNNMGRPSPRAAGIVTSATYTVAAAAATSLSTWFFRELMKGQPEGPGGDPRLENWVMNNDLSLIASKAALAASIAGSLIVGGYALCYEPRGFLGTCTTLTVINLAHVGLLLEEL